MTSSFLTRTGDLILGTEPKQRLRIYRSLMAASVYLICIALQGYACMIGFMHWDDAWLLSGLIVLNVAFWYGVLRLDINQRFDDPALPGEVAVTITLQPVACGTELQILQEGLPEAIPVELCYLGWQQSLVLLGKLVEAEPSA